MGIFYELLTVIYTCTEDRDRVVTCALDDDI